MLCCSFSCESLGRRRKHKQHRQSSFPWRTNQKSSSVYHGKVYVMFLTHYPLHVLPGPVAGSTPLIATLYVTVYRAVTRGGGAEGDLCPRGEPRPQEYNKDRQSHLNTVKNTIQDLCISNASKLPNYTKLFPYLASGGPRNPLVNEWTILKTLASTSMGGFNIYPMLTLKTLKCYRQKPSH